MEPHELGMAPNEMAATGMALLTAYVLRDKEAYDAILADVDNPGLAMALLGRGAEVVVNTLAIAAGVSKERALELCAQSVALVDQDDAEG